MSVNSTGYLIVNKTILDKNDKTKQLNLDLSSISTNTTRKLIVPNSNTTIVGVDTVDVLTNKEIKDSSNIVYANALKTTSTPVIVNTADPPTIGSVLTATTTTSALWSKNTVPNIYFNNLGTVSTPAVGNIKQYYGRVNTSSGTAVFNVTIDGTASGTSIFTNLSSAFLYTSCISNQSDTGKMPIASIKSISGKQVTVNLVRGNSVLLTIGLNYSPLVANDNNCDVYLYVVGS